MYQLHSKDLSSPPVQVNLRYCRIVGFAYSGFAIFVILSLFLSNYLETELLAAK